MSTVIASVAVVCAVALTNSVALTDSVGVPVKATPVVVPSPTAVRQPVEVARAGDVPGVATAPAAPQLPAAEIVPAPAPIVVTTSAPPAGVAGPTAEAAVAEAESSGTWEPVRQWATRNGWSQARIDAWVQRLEEKRADAAGQTSSAPEQKSKTPAKADRSSERQSAESGFGSKKDQSRVSPDRRD